MVWKSNVFKYLQHKQFFIWCTIDISIWSYLKVCNPADNRQEVCPRHSSTVAVLLSPCFETITQHAAAVVCYMKRHRSGNLFYR